MIAFADWPFAFLEVDLSTRKSPDTWGPMDPAMAEAMRRAAQRGARVFEISIEIKKVAWVYKIDFETWSQENLASRKLRRFRFAAP